MSRDTDLLVVGAGPTGLALALQARTLEATVRVVERRTASQRPSRALLVHPRTLEVLRPLGVTDALLERGKAASSAQLHLGHQAVPATMGPFGLPDTAFPYLLLLAQAEVEAVLARALAALGVEVERGVELAALRAGSSHVSATTQRCGTSEQVESRFAAGCDGPTSTVRAAAQVVWRGSPYRHEVVIADVELEGDVGPGAAHAFVARQGLLFLFALSEAATWRLLATRPARPSGTRPGPAGTPVAGSDLQALLDGAGLAARLRHTAWSAAVTVERRLARHYRRGPVFLAGDAAHTFSPAGGQGMNTGIQDAINLGWKLAFATTVGVTEPAPELLLDSYEAERRPVARRTLALTNALFWAEGGTDRLAASIRGVLAPLAAPAISCLLSRRRLVARGVRILSQLDVHYRRSTLSRDEAPSSSSWTRAGDRLPNEPTVVDGRPVFLHDLLARPGVHVLLAQRATWYGNDLLPLIHTHRIDSWAGEGALIVRPDGHVGYRSARAETAPMRRWLELAALGRSGMTFGPTG